MGTGSTGGGQGVHGVAPDAKVLSFRIPDMSGAGVGEQHLGVDRAASMYGHGPSISAAATEEKQPRRVGRGKARAAT